MSPPIATRGRETHSQRQVIDLTRDSPEPINTIMTPQRKRPLHHSHSTTSSTASTSTNGSSASSLFDEQVQNTPTTPGTPVEDLEQSQDPFVEATSSASLPQPLRLPFIETPTKRRTSTKSTTRETGFRTARSKQLHARSVSSSTKLSHSESIIDENNKLSPCPSGSSARKRASSGPESPTDYRTSHDRARTPDSHVIYPPVPRESESASDHLELEHTVHTRQASPIITRLTESRVKNEARHVSDPPCSQQRDQDHVFQRPEFDKYKLKREKDPLSDRVINGKIYEFLKGKQKANPKERTDDKACNTRPPYSERLTSGWVYIIESDEHAPCHVKIGITIHEPDWRLRQWKKCGMTLQFVPDLDRNAFDYHAVVESLIKYELHRCRRTFRCAVCKKTHEEWYEIDKTKAVGHITGWRNWIKTKQPFDKTGVLTPYWSWRVRGLPKILDDVDWDVWRNPGRLDYWIYKQESSGNKYYFFLKDHLSRKDLRFCFVGMFILLLLDIWCGKLAVMCATFGLIAL